MSETISEAVINSCMSRDLSTKVHLVSTRRRKESTPTGSWLPARIISILQTATGWPRKKIYASFFKLKKRCRCLKYKASVVAESPLKHCKRPTRVSLPHYPALTYCLMT
jgi:hypothetical protein